MHNWLCLAFMCVLLSVRADAAQPAPVPDNPPLAQTSLGFNPKTRCPDLRIADEGTIAAVIFWLPSSGTPSKISIRSSSGSDALDGAAISCVSRLRFAPATRLGDGELMDSWRQIAFRWADQGNANGTRVMTSQPQMSGAARAFEPIAGAPVQTAADARKDDSGGRADSVTVHVCADEAGTLKQDPTIVRSSGNTSLDQAAVKIAASGSAYYRPDTSSSGPLLSGCAQLVIKFDTK
jgi:TonB family protein